MFAQRCQTDHIDQAAGPVLQRTRIEALDEAEKLELTTDDVIEMN